MCGAAWAVLLASTGGGETEGCAARADGVGPAAESAGRVTGGFALGTTRLRSSASFGYINEDGSNAVNGTKPEPAPGKFASLSCAIAQAAGRTRSSRSSRSKPWRLGGNVALVQWQ